MDEMVCAACYPESTWHFIQRGKFIHFNGFAEVILDNVNESFHPSGEMMAYQEN